MIRLFIITYTPKLPIFQRLIILQSIKHNSSCSSYIIPIPPKLKLYHFALSPPFQGRNSLESRQGGSLFSFLEFLSRSLASFLSTDPNRKREEELGQRGWEIERARRQFRGTEEDFHVVLELSHIDPDEAVERTDVCV